MAPADASFSTSTESTSSKLMDLISAPGTPSTTTSGDAAAFLAIDIIGTVITVILKGAACGLAAGVAYRLVSKFNRYAAVIAAAVVCPIVNTGVFLLGCRIFFFETIKEWGAAAGFEGTVQYMILGLVGGNFIFELISNMILSPVVVRILDFNKKADI